MGFTYRHSLTPSSFCDFKSLQFLQLLYASNLKDLAVLQGVPHVEVQLSHHGGCLLLSAGSWKSLQIKSEPGHSYDIRFADIEAFVRDNPKCLFETYTATKEWRGMVSALGNASRRKGLACFTNLPDGSPKRVSTIRHLGESRDMFLYASFPSTNSLVSIDEFWPKKTMHSCLSTAALIPKADVSECKCRLRIKSLDRAGQMVFWGLYKMAGAQADANIQCGHQLREASCCV